MDRGENNCTDVGSWSDSMNARFLRKLETLPCLWNRGSKYFTSPASRAAALYKLSQYMNLPGCGAAMMQRKVLELKGEFIREKRRMYECMSLGKEFVPRLRWWRVADNFWGKVIRIRRFSFYSDEEYTPQTYNNINKATCLDAPHPDTANAINDLGDDSYSKEFKAFGVSIAAQLSNMPLRAAILAEDDIQNAITRRKLEYLRKRQQKPVNSTVIEIDDEDSEWGHPNNEKNPNDSNSQHSAQREC